MRQFKDNLSTYGKINLYGTSTGYTQLTPGNNTANNITLTLPSSTGTLARTADNVASATKLQTARTINGTNFDGNTANNNNHCILSPSLLYIKKN